MGEWRRVWILLGVAACGGDDGKNTSTVHVTAHIVKGATGSSAGVAAPLVAPAPQDGTWLLSPDKVTAHISFINFQSADSSQGGGGGEVTGCDVTFDKTSPSNSKLLDCAIDVKPATYTRLSLQMKAQFEVTIDDPTNGFFSDPTASGKLSTTMPAGGAQPVTLTPSFGLSSEQTFLEPLVLGENAPDSGVATTPEISIVMDAVHTVTVRVNGGVPSIQDGAPIAIFPTVGMAGRAQFYTTSGTANSAYMEPPNAPSDIRVYDAPAGGQPEYLIISYAGAKGVPSNCFNGAGPKAAYAADAAKFMPNQGGMRPGGWLGRDSTSTLCWILATDGSYTTSSAYLTMHEVTTIGGTTSLTCENTSNAPHPTSGDTYASGCPAPTVAPAPDMFTLVAQ